MEHQLVLMDKTKFLRISSEELNKEELDLIEELKHLELTEVYDTPKYSSRLNREENHLLIKGPEKVYVCYIVDLKDSYLIDTQSLWDKYFEEVYA